MRLREFRDFLTGVGALGIGCKIEGSQSATADSQKRIESR